MAQVTKTHGDFQPIMNFDAPAYTVGALNASTSGATVQPQGPKLDFFTIELAEIAANGAVSLQAFQTITQLATIHMYEFTDTTTDTLAVAIYPVAAWTTTTLAAAIDAATGGTSTVTASATFTG